MTNKKTNKLERYRKNIHKTGFILEFNVSEILASHSWTIINNRYYVDDVTGNVREIDIVAYKTRDIQDITFFTTLLISCKKSEENDWVFLSKSLNKKDPNIDALPISNWSNDRILNYMLKNSDWKAGIENEIHNNSFLNDIYHVNKTIFASQEIKKNSGNVNNDKAIFNSISGLIKALHHELSSLPTRKKNKCFYNFNLLTVVDTEIYLMHFNGPENTTLVNSDTIHYLNRYIVGGEDGFYKITFCKSEKFATLLNKYNELHDWNTTYYQKLINNFYRDITKDHNKIQYQKELVKTKINSALVRAYYRNKSSTFEDAVSQSGISYSVSLKCMIIDLNTIDDEVINILNGDKELNIAVSKILKEYYRYQGKFKFDPIF